MSALNVTSGCCQYTVNNVGRFILKHFSLDIRDLLSLVLMFPSLQNNFRSLIWPLPAPFLQYLRGLRWLPHEESKRTAELFFRWINKLTLAFAFHRLLFVQNWCDLLAAKEHECTREWWFWLDENGVKRGKLLTNLAYLVPCTDT